MSGLRFESPWALVLLALIPAAMLLARRLLRHRGLIISSSSLLQRVRPTWRVRALPLLTVLRIAALVLLVVAIARPQAGRGRIETSTEAVAIQLVVDRSGSMNQEMTLDGVRMSRIDVVRRVGAEFVLGNGGTLAGRGADLVGLTTFARYAETICPPVHDARAVDDLIAAIRLPQLREEDGTAIGDALALAAARLHTLEEDFAGHNGESGPRATVIKSKVIVLLTDGDNNAGERDPLAAAQLAAEWGIRVYTVGVGAGEPIRVRTPFGDRLIPGTSEVDEETLQRIAHMTGGVYRRAQDGDALRAIYAEIDSLERSTVRTRSYTDYDERFAPLAIAAGAFVLLEMLLAGTILRRTP